jgi:hypothetical protein
MLSRLLIYMTIVLLLGFVLLSVWIIVKWRKGDKRFTRERFLGSLLMTITYGLPLYLGVQLSFGIKIPPFQLIPKYGGFSYPAIGFRIIILIIGVVFLIKILKPYWKSIVLVQRSGEIIIFDESTSLNKKMSWKQLPIFLLLWFLVGFGMPGVEPLLLMGIGLMYGLVTH